MSTIIDGTNGITLPSGAEVVSTTGTQTLTNKSISASQIDSGTMATARLGSGTADSTTFLRGDQTWATVSVDVMGTIAGASVGAVGTYGEFRMVANTSTITAGSTTAGSNLRYSGGSTSPGGGGSATDGATPSGTWRCMGHRQFTDGTPAASAQQATLWLRIS